MLRTYTLIALLTGSAPALAQMTPPLPPLQGTRLEIVAHGEVQRVPDIATISAGVVTQDATAAGALTQNSSRMTTVLAALRRAGVAERDLTTAQISLQPQYRYQENHPPVITGYQASNSVNVRFRDVARAGVILDALVAQGANQINGPILSIDRAEAALDEARVAAMATARQRAMLYARAAGLTVKRIIAINEQPDQPDRPVMMMQMRARADSAAKTEIVPGEQAVGIDLTVTFELQ